MRKIIGGEKDENGIFKPLSMKDKPALEADDLTDISIDDLLYVGLRTIRKALIEVQKKVNTSVFDREDIGNLKDLMAMLRDLKKEERDFLEALSADELEKLIK